MRWLVVCALLLAGCAEDVAPLEEDADEGFLVAVADEASGAISGVVVDEQIRPIADANVTLTAGATTFTDAEGRFSFEGLEPGVQFLSVSAARHLPTQTSVQVMAGEVAKVRVSLPSDGLPDPYFQTHHFQGSIAFHATVAWAQAEWMLDTYAGITTPACANCVFTFSSDETPTGHLFEAIWDDSLSDPRGPYELYWSYAVPEPYQELFGYAPSPILRVWETDAFEEQTGDYKVLMLGDYDSVNLDQTFEIFLSQWFNARVPEGWSIVQGTA